MKRKTKYALVLSGGGFKGAFQVGALNYLNDNWQKITGLGSRMKFDLIAGVSVGAINGSMLASNQLGLLNELWLEKIAKNGASEIYTSDFIDVQHRGDDLKMKLDIKSIRKRLLPDFELDLSIFKKLQLIFSKKRRQVIIQDLASSLKPHLKKGLSKLKALGDNSPLRAKLSQYLDRSKIKTTEFLCGFVSLDSGQYHSVKHSDFNSNEDFINGVLASSCIPMVYDPIESISFSIEESSKKIANAIDGGVSNVSPLGDVVKRINKDKESDYKIIIINCHSGTSIGADFTKQHIGQIAARSLYDIAFTEIFNNDVNHFLKINDLVRQARAWDHEIEIYGENYKPIKAYDAIVIQPDPQVDLGNALVVNERLINLRVNHGEAIAKKVIQSKCD